MNEAKILEDKNITAKQINELAEWLEDLSFEQLQFLKDSYQAMLKQQALECNSEYVQ